MPLENRRDVLVGAAATARWCAAGADMPLVFIRPNLSHVEIERTLGAFTPMLESRERP